MEKIIMESNVTGDFAVVVAGIDHYNALGIIRSLGEIGAHVYYIVKADGNTFVEHSKYIKKTFRISKLNEIEDILMQLEKEYNNVIVFPVTDEMALYFDVNGNKYKNCIIPGMEGDLGYYMDKNFSKRRAASAGLLIPKGIVMDLRESAMRFVWTEFPCIVKPEQSIEGRKCDIEIAKNDIELDAIIAKYINIGYRRALVEEYISGDVEFMVEIIGERSKRDIILGPIIRKIREYPMKNGSTSYAEFVEKIQGLDLDAVKRYVEGTNFYGLFDVELKYADGKIYFIECNFRNGAPSHAVTKYGINIPALWISEMLNREVKTKSHHRYTRVMVEQTDILNVAKRNVNPIKWIVQFVMSKKLFWDLKDISPCIYYYRGMIKLALRRLKGNAR